MPFPLIAAAAAAIPGLIKGISGAVQARKGKKELANLQRPEYTIPQEVLQASRMAQNQYLQRGLPGQELMENKVMGGTARAINDAKAVSSSSADALDAVTKIYAGEQDKLNGIGMAAAQQDLQDAAAYRQQLGVDADYAEKKWDMNTFQPYLQKYGDAKAKIAAGNMNLNAGLDTVSQVATAAMMGGMGGGGQPTMGQALGQANLPMAGTLGYQSLQNPIPNFGVDRMGTFLQKASSAPPQFGTNRKIVFNPLMPVNSFQIK